MKYFIVMLMLFSQTSFAEDWEKLIDKAPSHQTDFFQFECPQFGGVVKNYRFEGSAVVYIDVLDDFKNIHRKHVIDGVGCTITQFRTSWKHVLQKLQPEHTKVPKYEPLRFASPKISKAEEIESKKRATLKAITDLKTQLNNDRSLYTSERIKIQEGIKALEKQYLELIKEENE